MDDPTMLKETANKTTFTSGNQAATKHGGEAAVKALQRGEPLKGLAAEEVKALEAQVHFAGWSTLLHQNAIRANAAAALYWDALQQAINAGNLADIDKYTARFGWLVGVSNRSILEAMRAEKLELDDTGGIDAVIQEYREGGGDASNR